MKILNQFDTTYYVLHDLDNVNRVNSELKKQLTNCKKILDAKNSYSEIFAINHTFEAAFYDNTVDNSIKIKRIFKILYEDDFKNKDIKKTILGTFNHIFSLDISELEFGKEYISQNVISISNSNDLEGRFSIASDE